MVQCCFGECQRVREFVRDARANMRKCRKASRLLFHHGDSESTARSEAERKDQEGWYSSSKSDNEAI